MKNIFKTLAILSLSGLAAVSCEKFLDTENLTMKDTGNCPTTQVDAEELVTGIYATMNNLINYTNNVPFYIFEMAGDDRFGGGSTSNVEAQAPDRLLIKDKDFYQEIWKYRYQGIFRANNAIETIPNVKTWNDEAQKDNLLGQAHFLRALFYDDLALVFGQVPLVLETKKMNLPKAEPKELYAQITEDLLSAIDLLPSTPGNDGGGRATKWAAEALLARVYLFYTGFYGTDVLPRTDGTTLSKSEVVKHLEDCINNSGHDLVPDQRNIWPYSNEYTSQTYPYGKENNLHWVGDGCIETVFALKFSNTAEDKGDPIRGYCNRICEYFALRDYKSNLKNAYPFSAVGYSNGPVSRNLFEEWEADPNYGDDYRRLGSICDVNVELPEYGGAPNKEIENTRLICKKYQSVKAMDADGKQVMAAYMYGGQDQTKLGNCNDLILIRFADVLLMHSELTGTNTGLNRVRQRANLSPLPYSLENIKKERRYELCCEGLRWNDLRRWGDAKKEIVRTQVGQHILNQGHEDTYKFHGDGLDFASRYDATKGFFMIPDAQIVESNGVLEQNDGWKEQNVIWKKHPYSTI